MLTIVCTCNIIKNVLWQGGWSCRYLFLFSLFSVPFCLNRCRDFMLQPKAVGKAAHVVFSCQLLLAAPAVKEEFARNALQNVRDRRDGLYLQR